MKQFALTNALIFYLITSAIGQGKTYFGLEFSVGNDLYKLSDNGDYLTTVPLVDAQGGITIRKEIILQIPLIHHAIFLSCKPG